MSGVSVTDDEINKLLEHHHIIIYDGVCNFCNWSTRFIIKRDCNQKFLFTPMQSDLAQNLIRQHKIYNVGYDTFLLIKKDSTYIWTDAAIEITKNLNGFWWLFQIFKIIPRILRDYLYRLFARNRYTIFGRTQICQVPPKEKIDRFIDLV